MILKRAHQLDILEKNFIKPTSGFLFIFGRKEIGKTLLVQEYTKNKETLFFSCIEVLPHLLFESFKQQVAKIYDIENRNLNTFSDFLLLLNALAFTKKTVIVFDDIDILSKVQKECLSSFYKQWNDTLKYKNIQILFTSSKYSSLKEDKIIYSKACETIFLKSFEYEAIKSILPYVSKDEQLKLFALFGTNINYLRQYNTQKSFDENIKEIFKQNAQKIQKEGLSLLKNELCETATYASILYAIAQGKSKIGEIAQALEVKSSYLTRYLQKLLDLMIISKIVPINEELNHSKFGRYKIEDNYLKFWFKCIYFNTALFEENSMNKLLNLVSKELEESLLQEAFKQTMSELILRNFEAFFKYQPLKVGSWWSNKEKEIDIVAYDASRVTFVALECNATQNVKALYEELKTKSEAFETVLTKKFALFSTK